MTPDTFNKLLERKLNETRVVLAGKAEEYSHGGDRLSNFKRAAGVLACTPEQALLSFVTKHITALYDFVQALGDGRCMTLDQWAEKTGDIRNYMVLLDALIEERLVPRTSVAAKPGFCGCGNETNFTLNDEYMCKTCQEKPDPKVDCIPPRKPAALHSGRSGDTYYCECGHKLVGWNRHDGPCPACGSPVPPRPPEYPPQVAAKQEPQGEPLRCAFCGKERSLSFEPCPHCGVS